MGNMLKYLQYCYLLLGSLTLTGIIILYKKTDNSEAILLCNMIMTIISFPISLVAIFIFPIFVKIQEIAFPAAHISLGVYAVFLNWITLFIPGLLQWFTIFPFIFKMVGRGRDR